MKTRSCFTCLHFNVCEMANVVKNSPVRFNIDEQIAIIRELGSDIVIIEK